MTLGISMKAMMRMVPPQSGQRSGSTSYLAHYLLGNRAGPNSSSSGDSPSHPRKRARQQFISNDGHVGID